MYVNGEQKRANVLNVFQSNREESVVLLNIKEEEGGEIPSDTLLRERMY